jgi:hypothetical protein
MEQVARNQPNLKGKPSVKVFNSNFVKYLLAMLEQGGASGKHPATPEN